MRTSSLARFAAVVAAVSLGAAACGSSEERDAPESNQTRTITDTYLGDVDNVPVNPERVVVLWRTGAEVVDLGVTPVGQLDGEISAEELGEDTMAEVGDVPVVGTYEGVDIEKVIALEPDLIVGMDHGGLSIDYEPLQDVAATVIFEIAEPTDVWANYPKVADVLGLTTDFDKRNAELTEELKQVATEYADVLDGLGEVTSVGAEYDGSKIYIDTSKSLTFQRLELAGFTYNPTYTDNPARYVEELTTENVASLADQDVLFYDVDIDHEPATGVGEILELASFKRLPAVQNGRLFPLTAGTFYTFDAAHQQIADIRAALDELRKQG
ncbi:MAG TPA: ABC transporter substrate-binding protein [Aeromicrobium sp.]|nr:ABC transporter substrate-binding protein [Aeromicrobium sp.]